MITVGEYIAYDGMRRLIAHHASSRTAELKQYKSFMTIFEREKEFARDLVYATPGFVTNPRRVHSSAGIATAQGQNGPSCLKTE